MEEQKWRIKSCQLWLQGGDKNSTFFHKQTTVRKIRNNVTSITDDDGHLQTSQDVIKKATSKHYSVLLTETKEAKDYSNLLQYLPTEISDEIDADLTKEIEEEEIQRAIWALQPDKAPSPDGFPISFYRSP